MHGQPAAEEPEHEEAREGHQHEAGQRVEAAVPLRRQGQGDRERRHGVDTVRGPERPPGDCRERDEEAHDGEASHVSVAEPLEHPADGSQGVQPSLPLLLRLHEGERPVEPQPERERVQREQRGRDAEHGEPARPTRLPGEHPEGRDDCRALWSREDRQPRDDPRGSQAPPLREQERAHRERQEQRLRVGRAQEDRGREHAQVQHRAVGGSPVEPAHADPVHPGHRERPGDERDGDARERVAAAQQAPERCEQEREEREERGRRRRPAIAELGDARVPARIPADPHVRDRARELGVHRPPETRLVAEPVGRDDDDDDGEEPDRRAAEEEEPDRGPGRSQRGPHGRR